MPVYLCNYIVSKKISHRSRVGKFIRPKKEINVPVSIIFGTSDQLLDFAIDGIALDEERDNEKRPLVHLSLCPGINSEPNSKLTECSLGCQDIGVVSGAN